MATAHAQIGKVPTDTYTARATGFSFVATLRREKTEAASDTSATTSTNASPKDALSTAADPKILGEHTARIMAERGLALAFAGKQQEQAQQQMLEAERAALLHQYTLQRRRELSRGRA